MQETVFRRICNIIDRYDGNAYRVDGDNEYSMEEEIELELMAATRNEEILQFSVENITAFDGPSSQDGVLCCAWIETNGQLETCNVDWHLY